MSLILVTGSTGTIGSQVTKALASVSGVRVRAAVRATEQQRPEGAPNIEPVQLDFTNPATAAAALKGVDKVFLLPPMLDNQVELMSAFVDAVRAAGVKHVVKLSAFGCEHEPGIALGRAHRAVEKKLESSGLAWTFLRPNNFMENFLTFYRADAGGNIYLPWGQGACSFVAASDVGAVAAAALTSPGHEGKAYVLTGPEGLTIGEAAKTISSVTGVALKYVDVPEEAAQKAMREHGMADGMIAALMELHAIDKAGYAAVVTKEVNQVLQRPPKTFREFVVENAAKWKRG